MHKDKKTGNTPDAVHRLSHCDEDACAEIALYGLLTGIRPSDLQRMLSKLESREGAAAYWAALPQGGKRP